LDFLATRIVTQVNLFSKASSLGYFTIAAENRKTLGGKKRSLSAMGQNVELQQTSH
jgi:hypothetical protein